MWTLKIFCCTLIVQFSCLFIILEIKWFFTIFFYFEVEKVQITLIQSFTHFLKWSTYSPTKIEIFGLKNNLMNIVWWFWLKTEEYSSWSKITLFLQKKRVCPNDKDFLLGTSFWYFQDSTVKWYKCFTFYIVNRYHRLILKDKVEI